MTPTTDELVEIAARLVDPEAFAGLSWAPPRFAERREMAVKVAATVIEAVRPHLEAAVWTEAAALACEGCRLGWAEDDGQHIDDTGHLRDCTAAEFVAQAAAIRAEGGPHG